VKTHECLRQPGAAVAASMVVTLLILAAAGSASAQCRPVAERTREVGCWIVAQAPLDDSRSRQSSGISTAIRLVPKWKRARGPGGHPRELAALEASVIRLDARGTVQVARCS